MDASLQSRAEQLASEIASQARTAEDLNGLMRLMMKSALERMLDTEMDVHLGRKTLTGPAASAPRLLGRWLPRRPMVRRALTRRPVPPNALPIVGTGVPRRPCKVTSAS